MSEQNKDHKILRIGIDIDDVLIKSAIYSIQMYNKSFGTHLTLDDWYDFSDPKKYGPVWGTEDDALLVKRVVDTMLDPDFEMAEPVEGSQDALSHLAGEGHELFAITGRSSIIRPQTLALLDKNFPHIFSDERVTFVDHFEHEGKRVSKADVGLNLKLTHFIEDLPAHANALARVGIKTVLLNTGDYKWSRTGIDPEVANNVIELDSWRKTVEYLDAEAA